MSIPQIITLVCGCQAVWNNEEWQHNAHHTCDQEAIRNVARAKRRQSHDASERRSAARLESKPFRILR